MSEDKKRINSLLRRIALGLAALLLGVSIYRWNARSLLGNQLPMPFGYGMAAVLSGSMEPRLSVGDLVIIRQTDTVCVGDIVVFQEAGRLIIHRVVSVDGQTVQTMGDANTGLDDPVAAEAVKGVLIFDVPGLGAVVQFTRQPLVVAVILAAAVFLMERSYRKEKDEDAQELSAIQQEIRKLLEETKEDL